MMIMRYSLFTLCLKIIKQQCDESSPIFAYLSIPGFMQVNLTTQKFKKKNDNTYLLCQLLFPLFGLQSMSNWTKGNDN